MKLCEVCGEKREHEFWARCNDCQKKAAAAAYRKLAASTSEQFARAVAAAAKRVARERRKPTMT